MESAISQVLRSNYMALRKKNPMSDICFLGWASSIAFLQWQTMQTGCCISKANLLHFCTASTKMLVLQPCWSTAVCLKCRRTKQTRLTGQTSGLNYFMVLMDAIGALVQSRTIQVSLGGVAWWAAARVFHHVRGFQSSEPQQIWML